MIIITGYKEYIRYYYDVIPPLIEYLVAPFRELLKVLNK